MITVLLMLAMVAVFYSIFFLVDFVDTNTYCEWFVVPTMILIVVGGILCEGFLVSVIAHLH